jgi:soluble cytochrome b562
VTTEPEPRPTVAQNVWGRVDDHGDVFVRTGEVERKIGSWQVGEPEQALDFFGRKYDDLAIQVDLLEQRLGSGAAAPDETQGGVRKLREALIEPHAIGDLALLSQRLDAIEAQVAQRRAERRAERAQALEAARERKEEIARQAEAIAESDDWRHGADRLRTLLDEWKTLPRLDRATDDQLWRRFSTARTHYTRRRKTHFAEVAERRDHAKVVKEEIVAEAEVLATSIDWGPTARRYRELMNRWKEAGPAPKPADDALWQRFRAAQDTFFTARSSDLSKRDTEQQRNLEAKQALLAEAEALVPITDWKAARETLRSIHERWETAGHVPREVMRTIEGRLRRVEDAVRAAEQREWRRTNPEARARAEVTVAQLRASIADLESQAAAHAAADPEKAKQAQEALAARRSWLEQAERALDEFRG